MVCAEAVGAGDEVDQELATADVLVNQISKMEVTHKDILRTVQAHKALQRFGRAIRRKDISATELYGLSEENTRIQEFWSHSWRASNFWKVWLLLMLKNGKAACIVGSAVAFFIGWLTYMDLLPGWYKIPSRTPPEFMFEHRFSPWSLIGGLLAALVVLLLWPSQTNVFLDRACIHQRDPERKVLGVMNVGAFLHKSESLLVIWDPSYLSRAWCLFELAAFIRSHQYERPPPVVIKPLALAPATFAIVMGASFTYIVEICLPSTGAFLYLQVAFMVAYASSFHWLLMRLWRGVEEAQNALREFCWAKTSCYCCEQKHVVRGERIPCDKELLEKCIVTWFGSMDFFEHAVQTDVLELFTAQLGRSPFGFRLILGAHTMILWGQTDLAMARAHAGNYQHMAGLLAAGLVWWVCIAPTSYYVWVAIARWQSRGKSAMRGMLGMVAATMNTLYPHAFSTLCFSFFLPNYTVVYAVLLLGNCCMAAAAHCLLRLSCQLCK